jgi:lipopolysaccharide export system permease protein
MKILDRYIAAAVVTGTLVALLIVVGLDIFFNMIAQLDNVGRENYTLLTMIQFVALITPQSMYELFPMAALPGSLMGWAGFLQTVSWLPCGQAGCPSGGSSVLFCKWVC